MALHYLLVMCDQLVEELQTERAMCQRPVDRDSEMSGTYLDSLNEGEEKRCGLEQLSLPQDCC